MIRHLRSLPRSLPHRATSWGRWGHLLERGSQYDRFMDWSLFLVSALAVPGAVLVWSGWGFRSSRAMSLGLCFAFVSVTSTTAAWLGIRGWWPPIALTTLMWGCTIGATEFGARRRAANMVRGAIISKAPESSQ